MAAVLQQQVQEVLENQPLHVHRLGTQAHLAQSPTIQAMSTTQGVSFLNVTDEQILRLTRPAGTYQQLVDRFKSRYSEALDGQMKVCFVTSENLPELTKTHPTSVLRRFLNAFSRDQAPAPADPEVVEALVGNEASYIYDVARSSKRPNTVTVELPRGSVGMRMNHLSDEAEPYSMGVTQSKLLRSRSLFLTAQIGHEIGHAVYKTQDYGLEVEDQLGNAHMEHEAYLDHIEECYADAMSVYIAAQMHGQRGLDYVQHDSHLRTLSLQNDVKYYTSPVMRAAIVHAQELLDNDDLSQYPLDELGEMAERVWYDHIPTMQEFTELQAAQQAFTDEIDRVGNIEDVKHPLRDICEEAWAALAEEFEPAEERSRQEVLQQYYNEVSQSLRGYGSRAAQLHALVAIDAELTEEADLNQQLIGRDDLELDELEPGELQIAERRAVVDRMQKVITQEVALER